MNEYDDLTNLPHPADIESDIELVGLYMKVYSRYVKVSKEITARISSDLDLNKRLGKLSEISEAPLERWLVRADDYMPDWFSHDLLNY